MRRIVIAIGRSIRGTQPTDLIPSLSCYLNFLARDNEHAHEEKNRELAEEYGECLRTQ